jgi:hypothetical protein
LHNHPFRLPGTVYSISCIPSYPPYLEPMPSRCRLRMSSAVVTNDSVGIQNDILVPELHDIISNGGSRGKAVQFMGLWTVSFSDRLLWNRILAMWMGSVIRFGINYASGGCYVFSLVSEELRRSGWRRTRGGHAGASTSALWKAVLRPATKNCTTRTIRWTSSPTSATRTVRLRFPLVVSWTVTNYVHAAVSFFRSNMVTLLTKEFLALYGTNSSLCVQLPDTGPYLE